MLRRTLIQKISGMLGFLPFSGIPAFAQSGTFTSSQRIILLEVASVVLPSELGKSGFEDVTAKFERYVREYRAGADTDHGYGFTHVIKKSASPAVTYAEQLSSLPSPVTRSSVEQALQQSGVKEMPRVPDGKSVIVDLMSFYFRSSEANDLCYSAAIGRDQCRGLDDSEAAPRPLRRSV
jgi:hypothetical protein